MIMSCGREETSQKLLNIWHLCSSLDLQASKNYVKFQEKVGSKCTLAPIFIFWFFALGY